MPVLSARRRATLLLAALVAAGCAPAASGPGDRDRITDGAYTVRVRNDAGVSLTAVRILTSEADTIEIARLGPGATSDSYGVGRLHSAPLVHVTAGGRQHVAHPVEGFVEGFNPLLEPGAYLLRLDVGDGVGVRLDRLP